MIKVLKQRILHTNNILFIFLVLEDVLFTLAIPKNFDSIILCLLCFMNWWYSWGVIHSLYRIVDVCIFFFHSCNILQPYLLAMVRMSSDAVFILHGCFTNQNSHKYQSSLTNDGSYKPISLWILSLATCQ